MALHARQTVELEQLLSGLRSLMNVYLAGGSDWNGHTTGAPAMTLSDPGTTSYVGGSAEDRKTLRHIAWFIFCLRLLKKEFRRVMHAHQHTVCQSRTPLLWYTQCTIAYNII